MVADITFTNTKHTWMYLLQNKSQALQTFIQFKTMIENQLDLKRKAIQTDCRKEYTVFAKYLKEHAILHRFSCPYTHEQNGSAGRKHRHITEIALTPFRQCFSAPSIMGRGISRSLICD